MQLTNKGYLVADYELEMPFEDFKSSYGGSGSVEYETRIVQTADAVAED